MTKLQFGLFHALLAAPFLYQRSKFAIVPQTFATLSPIRRITGLNIHHGHWGLLWIFLGIMISVHFGQGTWTTLFFGLGLGLILDEIIPALQPPGGNRSEELEIYRNSFTATAILVFTVILFSLVLSAADH